MMAAHTRINIDLLKGVIIRGNPERDLCIDAAFLYFSCDVGDTNGDCDFYLRDLEP